MNANVSTVIKLLEGLKKELDACMPRHPGDEAILLGDFIVEAYNDYLERAKLVTSDETIHRMSPLRMSDVPLRAGNEEDSRRRSHPRVAKMREVGFHVGQLLVLLEEYAENGDGSLVGVMTLLDSLGDNVRHIWQEFREGGEEGMEDVLAQLVSEYNRCLEYAQTARQSDKMMGTLFHPLEAFDASAEDKERAVRRKLSEVEVAQSSLAKYLSRTAAREK